MLRIVCVNAGNYCGRGREYVEILYDMVGRNLMAGIEASFICFTDDAEPYPDIIEKRPLHGGLRGWWNKLYLFKKGHFEEGDRVIYFDLDTCIVGNIDPLVNYRGKFAILRDAYRPQQVQSSIMLWEEGGCSFIWDGYEATGMPQHNPHGDQAYIDYLNPDILQEKFPEAFVSYREQAQYQIPRNARAVFFHGDPKPDQVKGSWVEHVWKIGGGTVLELDVVCNVPEAMLRENILHACMLSYENLADQYYTPNDQSLLIVGGGPSLADNVEEIKAKHKAGAIVWALNNSFSYLVNHGLTPHGHVMLDARPENAEFVPQEDTTKLYASQCHPDVFAKGGRIIIWHAYSEEMPELMNKLKRKVAFVGAGSSVGLKAMALAQLFGFKDVHLYGYDSSYRDDKNHAYEQKLNSSERIIDVQVNGFHFRCAPWMATQCNEFKQCIGGFLREGMVISVHGEGLLPYVAKLIA